MRNSEMNFKVNFFEKYFKRNTRLDIAYDINQVDAVIFNKISKKPLLYIEAKKEILNKNALQKAIAQIVLTNKIQKDILDKICVIYYNQEEKEDILVFIDCSDNSIMFNNDFNWKKEMPSQPSIDAIFRINDRVKEKISFYRNEEIKKFFKDFFEKEKNKINISQKNFIGVFHEWKNTINFSPKIEDEQKIINLFIVDLLNKRDFKMKDDNQLMEVSLSFEGTELDKFTIINVFNTVAFAYVGKSNKFWKVENFNDYNNFWKKFNRPSEEVFKFILEHSAKFYTDKYRSTTGAEYTPVNFVKLQNKRLKDLGYNLNEYIVFDPCAGVGNLENQFGQDYKEFCFLSTLEQMDANTCKSKGFETAIQYDFLKDNEFPKFKHEGQLKDIRQIAKDLGRKLMIVMNPPYKRVKGIKNNLAIEFFNKCLKLEPETIVFYYQLEGLIFKKERKAFLNSNYKINSFIISNAKETFKLANWGIGQVIFDKNQGKTIDLSKIEVERYEVDKEEELVFKGRYCYDESRPNLIKEIENKIKENKKGIELGRWSYLSNVLMIGNGGKESNNKVTSKNLKYCLLSKGINFNSSGKYYERNGYCYRGSIKEISEELFNDSIMFSLFYNKNSFSNKNGLTNYIMPFTHKELGCSKSDLNVLRETNKDDLFESQNEEVFDFREFMKQFKFSEEAMNFYKAALEIFKYYHKNYKNTNLNDSFYDITNTIMGKDPTHFKEFETKNDTRICRNKTAKGTLGFGRRTINKVIPIEDLKMFYDFFNARDILAVKINKQLVKSGLLLWERKNIY